MAVRVSECSIIKYIFINQGTKRFCTNKRGKSMPLSRISKYKNVSPFSCSKHICCARCFISTTVLKLSRVRKYMSTSSFPLLHWVPKCKYNSNIALVLSIWMQDTRFVYHAFARYEKIKRVKCIIRRKCQILFIYIF